jgi:hypothetical protein
MALREKKVQQFEILVATRELAGGPGHPLYRKFNEVLSISALFRVAEGFPFVSVNMGFI